MSVTETYRTLADLADAGLLSTDDVVDLEAVAAAYATALPVGLAALGDAADPDDPVLRQYIPTRAELSVLPHERADPIGDERHSPLPGLVHRYPDRVLLKVTAVCPVYCRFCFRREQVGPAKGEAMTRGELAAAAAYIAARTDIFEVILTGGDPFMLSERRVAEITAALSAIAHVKVIRWHTRMPVADPARVTAGYARAIAGTDKAAFVAVHANHAAEIGPGAREALGNLRAAGVSLVSQTVLLRGVNDSLPALASLMRAFLAAGVKPYYLHQLDPAPGTSHFNVPVVEGQALVRALRDEISGLGVPHYIVDIPGGVSKANLALSDVEHREDGLFVRGRDGRAYPIER